MTKFKVGDQVRIVNYGHLIQLPQEGKLVDINPALIGRVDIIIKAKTIQEIDSYAFEDLAWFNNDQLELVYRPEYKQV